MKKLILFSIGIFLIELTNATDFSSKQQAIIYNEAINSIHQYENLLNTMASQSVDLAESNKTGEKFIELFIARKALIYNDLDPAHQLSEFYELDTYVANLQLWYPDGLKVKIDFDNMKAGNIISHEENVFTVDIMASKKMNGNYVNKTQNSNNEEMLFRVAFFKEGAGYKGFKIAGIRSTTSKAQNDSKLLAEVKGKELDEKEMSKVKSQVIALVNDYVNFLNLLADPKETADDKEYYKTAFLNLFGNEKVNHVNDIEPKPEKRWLNTTEYLQNYIQAFPEGIRNIGVNIDSAKYGKVIPGDNNKFSVSVNTDKFFSGKYKDKTIMRENSKLDIKVSFEKDENTYKNFRFEGIDKFEMNLNDQSATSGPTELPKLTISSLKRNGLHIGAAISYDLMSYNNDNLLSHDILKWESSSTGTITPSLVVRYYPLNQIGIETGISLDSYNAELKLIDGLYTSKISLIGGPNDYNYYQQINTKNYDSLVNYSYLRIPFQVIYHTNKKPEKYGFFIKAGISFSLLLKSEYTLSADTINNPRAFYDDIYHPENDYEVSKGEFEEYYNNKTWIDIAGKPETSSLSISFIASCGVTIPLGYFASIEAGPEIVYGLTNLYTKSDYKDLLDVSTPAQKVSFFKYGFRVGFNYKF